MNWLYLSCIYLKDGYDHAALYTSLVLRYHNLTEISGRQIDDSGLRALGMVHNSTLTAIEFSKVSLTGVGLTRVCTGCPNLKLLLLACENDCEVTDEDARSLAKCPQLEKLSMAKWTKITDASITVLASLSLLKGIDLSNCSGLTSGGVQSLLRSNRNLETIILSNRDALSFCTFCDDDLLSCIGECCPKLRKFEVDIDPESTVASEASLIALFQGCPLLESLLLLYEKFSDTGLCQLANYCPCLNSLSLIDGSYTDVGIIAVSSKCINLTHLELHRQLNITDASMISIAEHCRLDVLHQVAITSFTARGLCRLFEACTELTSVTLEGLPLVTDRSILTMVRRCPKLSLLALNANDGLTEKSLLGLVGLEDLGGIQDLLVDNGSYITDEIVAILARNCSKLKTITLTECPNVTEEALVALLTHGKHLTEIEIDYCSVELDQEMSDTYLTRRPSARRIKVDLGDLGNYII